MITHASQMHRLLYDRPRYEDLCAGELPTGYKRKNVPWEKIKALKNAMHKIVFAPEAEHFYLTCPANPFKLVCIGCKTFCRCACCPHVLAMTHMLEGEKPESERNGGLDLLKVMRTLNRPPSGGGAPDDAGEEGERGRYFRRRKARKAWTSQKGTTSKGKGVGGPGKRVVGGVGMGAGVKKKGKGTSKGAPRGGGRGGGKGGAEHRGVGGVGVVRGGLGHPSPPHQLRNSSPYRDPTSRPPGTVQATQLQATQLQATQLQQRLPPGHWLVSDARVGWSAVISSQPARGGPIGEATLLMTRTS